MIAVLHCMDKLDSSLQNSNESQRTDTNSDRCLDCYISTFHNASIDPYLEKEGFCHGMIAFAIPSLGILFKCRADGSKMDLEFGAFFALLKFTQTSLKKEKIDNIRVHSSSPEFVFAFTPDSPLLAEGSSRRKLLMEYLKGMKASIAYIEEHKNGTRIPPSEYPVLPEGKRPALKPDFNDVKKRRFKPFQRGIKL